MFDLGMTRAPRAFCVSSASQKSWKTSWRECFRRATGACLLVALMALGGVARAGVDTGLVGDDVTAGPFPIGFSFNFYGQPRTQFYATTNGLVQFSNPSRAYSNSCLPSGLNDTLFVYWDDLRTDAPGRPNGKIHYATVGEAPFRKLIVQWTNQYFYGTDLPMGTFQAVLSEGSDEIRYQYRYLLGPSSTGSSATIGVQGVSPQTTPFGCNQSGIVAEGQAVSFTPDAARTSYVVDAAAQFEFLDISGLTPEAPRPSSRYTKEAPVWSWDPIPDLNGYQIEIQSEAGDLLRAETLGNVATYTWASGFEEATTYRARVRGTVNNGGTWELWSGLSQPLTIDRIAPTVALLSAVQSGPLTVDYTFAATDATSGPPQIRLIVATDPEFANQVLDTTVGGTETAYRFTGAVAGQRLYARLQATDAAGNTSDYSATLDVVVLPAPDAAFEANVNGGEAPLSVALTNTTTGNASAYAWDFGNGQTSTHTSPTVRYSQPGSFAITLDATGIGGATSASKTITVTPDITPPAISNFAVGEVEIGDQFVLTDQKQFEFSVADANGLESVVVSLGQQAITLTSSGDGRYRFSLDPLAYPNGDYSLAAVARDVVGNESSKQTPIKVDLPPPVAPAFTSPASGMRTNQASMEIAGRTELGVEAQLLINGIPQAVWTPVVGKRFTISADLVEGLNRIAAVVRNNRGASPASSEIQLTLDTSKPGGAQSFAATSLVLGKVRLTWSPASDPSAVAYEIYRARIEFTQINDAQKVIRLPLSASSYEEVPPEDGTYFYRIVTVNALGTAGVPSQQVSVVSDKTLPYAERIEYQPRGKYDADSATYGQGAIDIKLSVNEPLLGTPYLSLVPEGGMPIAVELVKRDDTHYDGVLNLRAGAGAGLANVLFSARDVHGNRGVEVRDGASLKIDTLGPALVAIALAPVAPIKVDASRDVTATFTYDEAIASNKTPTLQYRLSGATRTPATLDNLERIDSTQWRARFQLPADAGLASVEQLSFVSVASDALDNLSSQIKAVNEFQVYQGELPPLNVPLGLKAIALPGGKAQLDWQAVDGASGYQLYRQAPGEPQRSTLSRSTTATTVDETPVDGLYRYSVASIRTSNGQESKSGESAVVEVRTSRTAPGAPQNLQLSMSSQGVIATWQPPVGTAPASYRLYRAATPTITSVTGLTPIKQGIKVAQAVDAVPSQSEHAYAVTALDAAGNESAISNSVYLNFSLLPVKTLQVEQIGTALPVLRWTANGTGAVGYDVYVDEGEARVKLTATPTTATTLTDTGFTAGERHYTVEAVDANAERMARSLTLPNANAQVVTGLPLKRNVMNRLGVQVSNLSPNALSAARLVVTLGARQFPSEPFMLAGNGTRIVPVVIGGYPDLPNPAAMIVAIENVPNEGELVRLGWQRQVDVIGSALVVGLDAENFVRGASGKVRLSVENTSDVEVELLTARNSGSQASNELRLKLLDMDGNLLGTTPYQQATGAGVVTLSTGQTVARIAPGQRYLSDAFVMAVPSTSPDQIRLRLEVDKLRYSTGQVDEVSIPGMGSERSITLSNTPYYGEVSSAMPVVSAGTQDITIQGRALDSESGTPVPNAPLKIAINQEGFERLVEVTSDTSGTFRYLFKPTVTDAGIYQVGAIHPDMTDRPDQARFTINRVNVTPSTFKLTVARNYAYRIDYRATTGTGSQASNLRIVYAPEYQESGTLLAGIKVEPGAPINIAPRQNLALPVSISGDNSAAPSGRLTLAVFSDGSGATPLALLSVDYTLTEAKPALYATPSFVQAGLAQGKSVIESVLLENKGFVAMSDVVVSLLDKDGNAAPGWISLASNPQLGSVAIGDKRSVDLNIAPSAQVGEGIYEFKLRIAGSNLPPEDVNVFVSVTQSGIGKVLFKASDIYTATRDKNGNLIPGLAGARIYLQNEAVIDQTYEMTTDAYGEAFFAALPAGSYKYRASAANHQEANGRFSVKPGLIVNQPVFLEYTLISVEWSVREVTIEDRYEITLNATFETDVPAPVVVLQPTSINLPKMAPGEVFQGELVLTNYGLVRADGVGASLPTSDDSFKFEFLAQPPTSLEAKQRVRLPYRVIALRSFGTDPGSGAGALLVSASVTGDGGSATNGDTGADSSSAADEPSSKDDGSNAAPTAASSSSTASSTTGIPGCYTYHNRYKLTCRYTCANGVESTNCGSNANWFYVESWGCPAGSNPTSGSGGSNSGGSWGSWGGSGGPTYTPMPGVPICAKGSGDCYEPKNKQSGSGNEGGE